LEVIINEQSKKVLKKGEEFGELALLYNATRSGSILAVEDSYLWAIDRTTFQQAIQELAKKEEYENYSFIKKIKLFEGLTD
jgi:CRP-like cAMP-binding protein